VSLAVDDPEDGAYAWQRVDYFIRYLPWMAAVFAVVIVSATIGRVVEQLGWNGDVASRYVIGETLFGIPAHGHIFATQPSYAVIDAVTNSLPGHSFLWQAYPYVTMVLAIGILAATLWRLAGRRAALIALTLGLSAAPAVLLSEAAEAFHGFAYAALIGLDATILVLMTSPQRRRIYVGVAVAAVLAGVVGATDPFFLVVGIAPMGVAGLAVLLRHRDNEVIRRAAVIAISASVLAGAVTLIGLVGLRHFGFENLIPGGTHRSLASISGLVDHAKAVAMGVLDLAAGLPFNSAALEGWRAAIGVAVLLCVATACFIAIWTVWRRESRPELTAHTTFWVASAVMIGGSFVVSDVVPGGGSLEPTSRLIGSVRFLVPLFFVAVALVPLAAVKTRQTYRWACIGVLAFAIWSGLAVVSATNAVAFEPHPALRLPGVIQTLEADGLTRGYGSYWDATPIWWNSGGQVKVSPTAEDADCGSSKTVGAICPMSQNSLAGWFTPHSGPTFILVDPENDYGRTAPSTSIFGSPQRVFGVGDITVFTYNYDVATRFLSTCAGRSDHGC